MRKIFIGKLVKHLSISHPKFTTLNFIHNILSIKHNIFVHINFMENKLWEYRNKRKITLKELSRLSGISVAQLNNIENGNTKDILLSNAIILSKILKVDLYELFCIK